MRTGLPTAIKAVKLERLSRYVLVNKYTGEIIDDNSGDGYANARDAAAAYRYKQNFSQPVGSSKHPIRKEDVVILTQPLVPVALHYLAPRTIMGDQKWAALKWQKRWEADHHCMICQRYVPHRNGDWLNLHERYWYDFKHKIQHYVGCVSICRECHWYIHQGLLGIKLETGEIDQAEYDRIITKGDQLLCQFGLKKIQYPDENLLYDPDWQLEFEGRLYRKSE